MKVGRKLFSQKVLNIILVALLIYWICEQWFYFRWKRKMADCVNRTDHVEKPLKILANLEKQIRVTKVLMKRENEQSKELCGKANSLKQQISKLKDRLKVLSEDPMEPSDDYERHRRRLTTNTQTMYDYLYEKFAEDNPNRTKVAVQIMEEILDVVYEHKTFILNDLEIMTRNDLYDKWRHQENRFLSDILKQAIHDSQFPKNCSDRRKLTCFAETTDCGWGCQVHHILECFTMALGLGRTLIYDSQYFNYGQGSLERVTKPFTSRNCEVNFTEQVDWEIAKGNESVIHFPFTYFAAQLPERPKFLPSAVPASLAHRLMKLNGHPISWWLGWIDKLVMRITPKMKKIIDSVTLQLDFKKPIVGVHVRRTDKLDQGEAKFRPLDDYMTHVESYYDQLQLRNKNVKRRVYLASEDPKVFEEFQDEYPEYEVISNVDATKEANKTRWTLQSLTGVVTDIYLLASCDYVVCTFSSNVCRAVLEKMQTKYLDAQNRVRSIDIMYHNYAENSQLGKIVHESRRTKQLGWNVGDLVKIYPYENTPSHFLATDMSRKLYGWLNNFVIEHVPEAVEFPHIQT